MQLFKRISGSRTWLLIVIVMAVIIIGIIWGSLQFSGKNRTITALQITMKPDTGNYFISKQDVSDMVVKISGNPIGKPLSKINLARMESILRKWPYLEKVQVFAGLDGVLKIQVVQRIPVLRVMNNSFETFFIDSTGTKIPYHPVPGIAPPDVIVANGNITEKFNDSNKVHSKELTELLAVAKFIRNNSVWNAQFEQCYVDNYGDIILIPRIGKHSIVIGSSENLPQKMENLRVFYEKGLRNIGWDTYSSISLKFQDQVVATRNAKQTEHKTKEHVQIPQH